MDITLLSVLWWSPQHAGFIQHLQPHPTAVRSPGMLLSLSQSRVSVSLGGHSRVQVKDGMGPR